MQRLVAPDQRADALRAADLVRRKRQQIGAQIALISQRNSSRAPGPHRHAGGRPPHAPGRRPRDRLKDAGLVVGEHQRDQRRGLPGARERLRQRRQIDARRRAVTATCSTMRGRKPPARQHRRMLDRRDQQPVAGRAAGPDRRRQRQHVGLGAARGEHHIARLGADQRRDLPRAPPRPGGARRGPSACTEDGLPTRSSAASHGGARLRAQRRGRIPVEIDAVQS